VRTAKSLGHSFDGVLVLRNVHDGHAGDLSDSSLQVLIASGHDVALEEHDATHDARTSRMYVSSMCTNEARLLA
jgi:hypothetical protein